jgi:ribosomal protein S18 acetylase RimI-like enzyme
VRFRSLSDNEWKLLRRLRLSALRDSPNAFLSTFSEEAAWTEDDWKTETQRGYWLVAFVGEEAVALLGATPWVDIRETERYLSYLWVAPGHRHRGIAKALITQMLERLTRSDITRLFLWVLGENDVAYDLYSGLGFETTGERQTLARDPTRYEERMALDLDRAK